MARLKFDEFSADSVTNPVRTKKLRNRFPIALPRMALQTTLNGGLRRPTGISPEGLSRRGDCFSGCGLGSSPDQRLDETVRREGNRYCSKEEAAPRGCSNDWLRWNNWKRSEDCASLHDRTRTAGTAGTRNS